MKICSVCQRCYENDVAECIKDNGNLISEPQISRRMIENFRLDSLLERDSVGESFLATQIDLDRQFVIKILDQNSINNVGEETCIQLGYEAQAAVELRHPNIANVHQFGTLDNGGFYTVTEFSGGQSLQEVLRNAGSLSEKDSVTIAEKAAEALIAAHDAGIVHRAVSPENIILSRDETDEISVKLQNFDLGGIREKMFAADADQGADVEILRYMSPEQHSGQTSDEKTDVYSLGIVLYEMLCGRSPFVAPTTTAISERKLDKEPLSKLHFDTRALFSNTIKEALHKTPTARLQAANFVRQLRHIAQVIQHSGNNYSEKSQLSLSQTLPDYSEIADRSSIINSSPILESTEIRNENQVPFEPISPIEIETAPANLVNPIIEKNVSKDTPEIKLRDNSDEISSVIDASNIIVRTNKPDNDSSEFASVSTEEHTAEAEPILVEKKQIEEDLYKTGSLRNENPLETRKLQFEKNEADDKKSSDVPASVLVEQKQSFDKSFDEDDSEPITLTRNKANAVPIAPQIFDALPDNVEPARKPEVVIPDSVNYSDEKRPPHRTLPANRSAFVGIGLLGLLIVSLVLAALFYNRNQPNQPETVETKPASSESQDAPKTSETKDKTAKIEQPTQSETKTSEPETTENTAVITPDRRTEQTSAAADSSKQTEPIREQAANIEPPTQADGKPQVELKNALDKFISATNSGNIEQQMNYYAPQLDAYYLSRNASQKAVRAEKKRTFSRADEIDIQAGKPDIKLSPDGRKATMRFRKKYAIKEGQKNRRGEVIQELRWIKSGDGWRIVSERDVKVINR